MIKTPHCIAALLSLLAMPTLASAQVSASVAEIPPHVRDDLARTHFRTGVRYFDLSRFAEAASEFERVYEYTGQSELLYNVARAHDAAGHYERALDAYRRFLEANADSVERAGILRRIESLRDLQSAAASSAAAGAGCAERPATTTPARPRPAEREDSVAVAPRPLLQLRTQVAFERSAVQSVGPFVLLGASVISGGLALWQGLSAAGHINTVNSAIASGTQWSPSIDGAYRSSRTEVPVAWGMTIAAGALGVGSLVWLLARGAGTRREFIVGALPTGHGAALTLAGTL